MNGIFITGHINMHNDPFPLTIAQYFSNTIINLKVNRFAFKNF